MKEHNEVQGLLALAAAGALTPKEQRRVQEHLDQCATCLEEFHDWIELAGALRVLPTPQAPSGLLVRTQELLRTHHSRAAGQTGTLLLPGLLIVFSWLTMFLNYFLMRWINFSLAQWLQVSSTTVWIAYIGITWLTTAWAAGLLVKHSRREGKTV